MTRVHRWTKLEIAIAITVVVIVGVTAGFFIAGALQNGWVDPLAPLYP